MVKRDYIVLHTQLSNGVVEFIQGITYDGQHDVLIVDHIIMVIPASIRDEKVCLLHLKMIVP